MKIFKPHSDFKWKQNVSIFSLYDGNTMFNVASVTHFTSGITAFFIIKKIFNISDLKSLIIINIIHIIEDYLENTSVISLESIVGKIIGCSNHLFISPRDEDTIQNYIGDNISFFLGSLLACYIMKYKNVNVFVNKYIYLIIFIMALFYILTCKFFKPQIHSFATKHLGAPDES